MSIFSHKETISFRQEIHGIDTFRGVAAILVFLSHFWALTGVPATAAVLSVAGLDLLRFFKAGNLGVDIFFVLSGFLLYYSLNFSKKSLSHYYLRRFLRIAPIYYFSLLVILIFLKPVFLTSFGGWFNIFQHLTFIHSFGKTSWNAINPVAWTLSHEMFFYLMLPFLFWLGGRKFWRISLVVLAMIVITFFYRDYLFNHFHNSYSEQIFGRLSEFGVGIFTSFLFIKTLAGNLKISKVFGSIIFVAGFVAFYVLLGIYAKTGPVGIMANEWTQVTFGFWVSLAFGVLLFGFLKSFSMIQRFVSLKIFGFFGVISYSFYLWHFVILSQVVELHLSTAFTFVMSFVLTFLLSTITYFLIERPFLKLQLRQVIPKDENEDSSGRAPETLAV